MSGLRIVSPNPAAVGISFRTAAMELHRSVEALRARGLTAAEVNAAFERSRVSAMSPEDALKAAWRRHVVEQGNAAS